MDLFNDYFKLEANNNIFKMCLKMEKSKCKFVSVSYKILSEIIEIIKSSFQQVLT